MGHLGKPAKVILIVSGTGLLVVATPFVTNRAKVEAARNEFRAAVARGLEAGMPEIPHSIRRKVEPRLNAAPFLTAAFAIAPELPTKLDRTGHQVGRSATDSADIPYLRRSLADASEYMALVERAAELPDCSFGHTYDNPVNETFPEFAKAKNAVLWLTMRAHIRALDGDTEAAFKDYEAALKIADHMAREPVAIGQLVGVSCRATVLYNAADTLYTMSSDEAAVRGALRLSRHKSAVDLGKTMRTEWTMYKAVPEPEKFLRLIQDANADGQTKDIPADRAYLSLAAALDHIVAIEMVLRDASQTPGQRLLSVTKLEEAHTAHVNERKLKRLGGYTVIAQRAIVKDLAAAELLGAAASAYQYRNRTGHFPRRIEDLGPYTPRDPWNDKHLSYRLEGSGFVFWSVGMDLKDDQAAPAANGSSLGPDHVIDMSTGKRMHMKSPRFTAETAPSKPQPDRPRP